ncbi:MAG: hypothetical protein JWO02_4189, partial [Solirubrobacterales bacterium]|nr:hypothetical protein [Solirubrobacterales bacterium]
VSPAVAAGLPGAARDTGAGSKGTLLALAISALVLVLIALDGLVLVGILRRGRRPSRRAGTAARPAPRGTGEGGAEPAGARAG